MKILILVIWLLAFKAFAGTTQCDHSQSEFRCVKYLKNYDGDTITFQIPNTHPILGDRISIRLGGVDTPEIKTKDKCEKVAARVARKFSASILKNAKSITLVNAQRGKYFRIVADVNVDGKSLSKLLIKNRLAVSYDGGTKQRVDWCNLRRPASEEK